MSASAGGLSPRALLLSSPAGYRFLRPVVGVSVQRIGYTRNPRAARYWPGYPHAAYLELDAPTRAWNEARIRALERLRESARACQADLVAGLRFDERVREHSGGLSTIELVVRGAALAHATPHADAPVLATLSAVEIAALATWGYRVVGVLAATTVTYVLGGYRTSYALTGTIYRTNRELDDLSRGLVAARRHAFARLDAHRASLVADGLVGVRYDQSVEPEHEERDLVVTLHVAGTAIVRTTKERPSTIARVVALDGSRPE